MSVRGLKRQPRHWIVKSIVVTVVVAVFIGAAIVAIKTFEGTLKFGQTALTASGPGLVFETRNRSGGSEKALTINLDRDVWTPDKDLTVRFKARTAYKRSDETADGWLAIAIQDFGTRKPREGEMLNGAIDRLRPSFADSLQFSSKLEPAQIGGLEAWRTTFTGRINVVTWSGECYLVPHHGFGYWVFIAAPTLESAQHQLAEIEEQKGIAFTTDRQGWTEQPPEMDAFTSVDSSFSVKAPENVWRMNDPKSIDDNAVLYLSGHFQSLQGQNAEAAISKNATLAAIALDKKGDLRESYKEFLAYLDKKKKEESKDYKYVPLGEKSAEGEVGRVGDQAGCFGDLRLYLGGEPMYYVSIAVFNSGAKTYGLRFDCRAEHREIWEKEFQNLLKTVRAGEK